MNKRNVFEAVLQSFRNTLTDHEKAAGAARDGASGDEVAQEGKYDTRATEASYLARGHAMQYEALIDDLRTLEAYRVPDYDPDETIGTGALVEVKSGRATTHYFILPSGGGTEAAVEGIQVVVVNARSPIAKELKGQRKGYSFPIPDRKTKAKVVSVC